MKHVESYVKWGAAALASIWYGLPELTQLLILLMVVDTIFGLSVAIKERKLSPTISWVGVTKKLGTLGMIWVAGLINPYNPIPEISLVQAASAFYIVPELLSITRNAALLGVPIFGQLELVLQYFRGVSGQGIDENTDLSKDTK